MSASHRYQKALDKLEGLVVARLFELTKMNMSRTGTPLSFPVIAGADLLPGYKLRKHIAKALQRRSQAIRTALHQYNLAAAAHSPPMPSLKWDEVVEYAFISEFDLLRQASREDISVKPWATPAGRMALDQHFKEVQARTEIVRLNVEIRRFITAMFDEEDHLDAVEAQCKAEDPILAFHIAEYRTHRRRFDSVHLARLSKLKRLPGFTGDLTPGIALNPYSSSQLPKQPPSMEDRGSEDKADDETDDDEDAAVGKELMGVVSVATDSDSRANVEKPVFVD